MSLVNNILNVLEKKKANPNRRLLAPADSNLKSIDPVSRDIKEISSDRIAASKGKLNLTQDQIDKLKSVYDAGPATILPTNPSYQSVVALLTVLDNISLKKIAQANIKVLSKMAKEILGDKADKTEGAKLLETGTDNGVHDHTHKYYLGDNRTQTGGDGHDHALSYHKGKLFAVGPAPDDGHIHSIN